MIRKFKVATTITTEHEIEIDTDKFDGEFMADYERYIHKVYQHDDDLIKGHVLNIAEYMAHNPYDSFIEGYGHIRLNGYANSSVDENEIMISVRETDVYVDDQELDEVTAI